VLSGSRGPGRQPAVQPARSCRKIRHSATFEHSPDWCLLSPEKDGSVKNPPVIGHRLQEPAGSIADLRW